MRSCKSCQVFRSSSSSPRSIMLSPISSSCKSTSLRRVSSHNAENHRLYRPVHAYLLQFWCKADCRVEHGVHVVLVLPAVRQCFCVRSMQWIRVAIHGCPSQGDDMLSEQGF